MTAFLPQSEPNPQSRRKHLEEARGKYRYNHTHLSPLALVDRVPIHDEYSFQWLKSVAHSAMIALENMSRIEMDEERRNLHLQKHRVFRKLLESGQAKILGLKYLVEDALRFNGRLGAEFRRPHHLDDYREFFQSIGLPPVAKDFRSDESFGWMRKAGPNAVMLSRLTESDERFPVTDEHLSRVAPRDSLESAMSEGRLFVCDYRLLDGAECGDFPHGPKYIHAPIALFVVDAESKRLLPVAIQCDQKPASNNPIITPNDGWNWMIAKTVVEIADGNIHEAVTHLGQTHLFIEPFVVSTYRQLAPNHPIAKLLAPHFDSTLAINEAAWKHLIADKGAIDKLFGASITAARGLTAQAVSSMEVNRSLLPATFEQRGVNDVESLPNYPYRDDTLLYWNAIRDWVADYIGLYYQSDAHVSEDVELQSWSTELASQDGGRIRGIGNDGSVTDLETLRDTISLIIFTCSVQHAAVNFPQYDLMSYTPCMPLAGYAPAPTSADGATEQDYLNMLPPLDMAELQMDLGFLLGTIHYTQLGQYQPGHFEDPRIDAPLQRFQGQLNEIGGIIEQRNQTRRPYHFLDPAGIPQSINI